MRKLLFESRCSQISVPLSEKQSALLTYFLVVSHFKRILDVNVCLLFSKLKKLPKKGKIQQLKNVQPKKTERINLRIKMNFNIF